MRKIITLLFVVLSVLIIATIGCGQKKFAPTPTATPQTKIASAATPTVKPLPIATATPSSLLKGTYEINESAEFVKDIAKSDSLRIPLSYVPESQRYYLSGRITVLTAEIGDGYIRLNTVESIDIAKNISYSGKPDRQTDYLFDNLGNQYWAVRMGGDYAVAQAIQSGREYRGYVDFSGDPRPGVNSFSFYRWTGRLKFAVETAQLLVPVQTATPVITPTLALSPEMIKQKIAEKFSPILWLHPDEPYEPKEVSIFVDQGVIRDKVGNVEYDLTRIPKSMRLSTLGAFKKSNFYLDFKDISLKDGANKYKGVYANLLKGNYETTVYARVVQADRKTVVQYWFFYFFNDGPLNKHEGDWEMVQLILNDATSQELLPEAVYYSQHAGGQVKRWEEIIPLKDHPQIYVAKGSHSNYFSAGNWVLGTKPGMFDTTSGEGKVIVPRDLEEFFKRIKTATISYELVLLPDSGDEGEIKAKAPWLTFAGEWGEWIIPPLEFFMGGPSAPATREIWNNPLKFAEP